MKAREYPNLRRRFCAKLIGGFVIDDRLTANRQCTSDSVAHCNNASIGLVRDFATGTGGRNFKEKLRGQKKNLGKMVKIRQKYPYNIEILI